MRYFCALLFLQNVLYGQSFLLRYPKITLGEPDGGDPGYPLFLTPYVESGNITEGRARARVPLTESLRIKSYAGYFTVNKDYDSNQFFWYFPAMVTNKKDAPVLVWLQGGPGVSSLYGLFTENGPLKVTKGKFERRTYNWAINHHIIYIDNPVGTGFSFTNDSKGYCTDETQVGQQLYSTVYQFFQLFPELQSNKFFISGESYAGKYVPALAYTIHKNNPTAKLKINLKGIAIGNGMSDPEHQLLYSKYLYQIGLLDFNQAKIIENYEIEIRKYIKNKQFDQATDTFLTLFYYFQEMTGFTSNYNYLYSKDNYNQDIFEIKSILQKSNVRKAIHVGNLTFNDESKTFYYLKQDMMKSVAPWISELLNYYNVLIYNGQLDIIVAYPLSVNYLRNLNFNGSKDYKTAKRRIWLVDREIAGYMKQAGKLVEIMVRNAGHMVPMDQPKWALSMITHFTHETLFNVTNNYATFNAEENSDHNLTR